MQRKYTFLFPIIDPDLGETFMSISVLTDKELCRRRIFRGFRSLLKNTYGASIKKEAMRRNLMIQCTTDFTVSQERIEEFISNISDNDDTTEDLTNTFNQSTDIKEAEQPLHPVQEGLNTTQAC